MKALLIALANLVLALFCNAQDLPKIRKDFHKVLFSDLVRDIEATSDFRFFFEEDWIKNLRVVQESSPDELGSILSKTLSQAKLDYVVFEKRFIVLVESDDKMILDDSGISERQWNTLTGVVRNAKNAEPLPYIIVQVPGESPVMTTADGTFSIRLKQGSHTLVFSGAGFEPSVKSFRLFTDSDVQVEMFESMIQLDEVEVTSSAIQHLGQVAVGFHRMSSDELEIIPPLFGEADIVRSVLSIPGVKTVGEGAGGFNVRGGNVDQNLILLDNVPIFNASHLFGLFSIVDPDPVQSLDLHKAGMPARMGGRLSSVLDIKLQDRSDVAKAHGEVSVGVLSSSLFVSSPLIKDKSSFLFSARGAYPSYILSMVPEQQVRDSKANFHDLTFKVNHRLNDRNLLSFTAHRSSDYFRLGKDTSYRWSSTMAGLQWRHEFSKKVHSRMSFSFSDNVNGSEMPAGPNNFALETGIKVQGATFDLQFDPSEKHELELGAQANYYSISRGRLSPYGAGSSVQAISLPGETGLETTVYCSDVLSLNDFFAISAGIRFTAFTTFDQGLNPRYIPNQPRNYRTLIEETTAIPGSVSTSFSNLEPRLGMRVSLSQNASIKGSYGRNFQYLTLLSNMTAVSPVDAWKLSDQFLAPQKSDQISIGYFLIRPLQQIEISVEGYYKKMANITQYKEGARLLLNRRIEMELLQGESYSYGVETQVKKSKGKTTGWVSYTYSRSLMRVSGAFDEETLSDGNWFPANFDKPHDVSLVLSHSLSQRTSVSSNFVYSTGRPITYPEAIYVIDGQVMADFEAINQARLPDYHRLDLSLSRTMLKNKSRTAETSWSIGFYNVYARRNPYSVFFRPVFNGRYPQAYRLSVLGSIIPYFSLNLKLR